MITPLFSILARFFGHSILYILILDILKMSKIDFRVIKLKKNMTVFSVGNNNIIIFFVIKRIKV